VSSLFDDGGALLRVSSLAKSIDDTGFVTSSFTSKQTGIEMVDLVVSLFSPVAEVDIVTGVVGRDSF